MPPSSIVFETQRNPRLMQARAKAEEEAFPEEPEVREVDLAEVAVEPDRKEEWIETTLY